MKKKLRKAPRLPKKSGLDCDGDLCKQLKSIERRIDDEKNTEEELDLNEKAIKEVLKKQKELEK